MRRCTVSPFAPESFVVFVVVIDRGSGRRFKCLRSTLVTNFLVAQDVINLVTKVLPCARWNGNVSKYRQVGYSAGIISDKL